MLQSSRIKIERKSLDNRKDSLKKLQQKQFNELKSTQGTFDFDMNV